eukprot:symbB.v1.2.027935.t1/scaffold2904.1/size67615/5
MVDRNSFNWIGIPQLHWYNAASSELDLTRARAQERNGTHVDLSAEHKLRKALLIESVWVPQRGQAARDLLRGWLRAGAPFLLKQFASYFAIWQKEMYEVPRRMSEVQEALDPSVDDIVWEHVQALIVTASGRWQEQCLHGKAVELVLEHCKALQPELRREAFAELLLRVGSSGANASVACAVALAQGEFTAQAQVMKRCFAAFWSLFPNEVFAVMAGLVHRVLKLDDQSAREALLDTVPSGARENAHAEDMVHLILCLLVFWTIARDKAAEGDTVDQAQDGLKTLVGEDVQAPGLLEILAGLRLKYLLNLALFSSNLILWVATPTFAGTTGFEVLRFVPLYRAMEQEEQEEEQDQQEDANQEVEALTEEDIRNFRPGDTVMTIRKRIREARKARLLEEQRSRSPSPMLHSRMPFVQQEAKAMAEGFPEARQARESVPKDGGSSGRPMPRKVERFHKDLIRKEVWRQKFNYLFRKMQAGVDLELSHDRKNRRLSIQQQRGREEEDAEARRQRVIAGIQESVERDLSKLRRSSGSPRHMARLADSLAKQAETEIEAEVETVETDTEATEEVPAICDQEVAEAPPPKPMAWRRTFPLRPKAPAVAPLPRQISREVPPKTGHQSRPKRGIGGLLQQSTSLPVLRTTPDLVGVRDEYYGGDELLMHEDILHTSNPKLFPLRGGHSRQFPTVKLSLPDFDLD